MHWKCDDTCLKQNTYSMYMHVHRHTCVPILLCSMTPSMLRVRSVPSTTVTDLSDSDVDGEIASCMNTNETTALECFKTLP